MIFRSMDTMNEVDDPRTEPLRMRTERDQLNNLIEQRTKYLKVPSEKMEEVRYLNDLHKYRPIKATYRQGKQTSANAGRGFVIINPEPNLPLIVGDIM